MPNIASLLKSEIARLARKELRSQTEGLKKAVTASRSDIVLLKQRVRDLEKALKQSIRMAGRRGADGRESNGGTAEAHDANRFRFRAKGLASNRTRLGLSAADFGLLVGASGQSVYAWEQGKAKPRGTNLAAIAALRGVGKREVAQRLAALKAVQ